MEIKQNTKIGICFGGYCPMHRGHLDTIMRAKKENDIVFVVVCGYKDEPRGKQIGIDLNKRYCLVKEFFKNDEIIHILKIDDTELGIDESMSDSNWNIWHNAVMRQIANLGNIDIPDEDLRYYCQFTYYVAEEFYYNKITSLLKINCILIPKNIPVSGTKIRKNPIKYWDYIVSTFRPYFSKNILISGTASEGKTTLVNDIRKYFSLPYTTEFGRDYMENKNITDTDLYRDDFCNFIIGQYNYINNAINYSGNRGVTIHDTDNLITLMYAKRYSEDKNMQNFEPYEYQLVENLAKMLNSKFKWDKIFLIKPHAKFVDDGTRYMEHASILEREKNFECLLELIHEFGYDDKVIILENGSYLKNFNYVKDYINSILNS